MLDGHVSADGDQARLTFFAPSERLRDFITTYYLMEIDAPPGYAVDDWLPPEWANVRFVTPGRMRASIGGGGEMAVMPPFVAAGPTSIATRFSMEAGQSWGIGFMPAGWAQFIAAPAHEYVDRAADGTAEQPFMALAPLQKLLADPANPPQECARLIDTHLLGLLGTPSGKLEKIGKAHSALLDPAMKTVAEMAHRTGLTERSFERFSREVFGFSAKLLLRRQRFLRSLAQFMLDPSLSWLETMDMQYHDQAHFVRDFRQFMCMTPTAYAKLDKPVMLAAAAARSRLMGEAVQVLHSPERPGPQ